MNLHINNDLNYPSPFCEPNASSFSINKRGNFSFSFLVFFFVFFFSISFFFSLFLPPSPLTHLSLSEKQLEDINSWINVPDLLLQNSADPPGKSHAVSPVFLEWQQLRVERNLILLHQCSSKAISLISGHLLPVSTPPVAMTAVHSPLQWILTTTKEYGACDQEFGDHWLCWLCPNALGSNSLSLHLTSCVTAGSPLTSIWPVLCGFLFKVFICLFGCTGSSLWLVGSSSWAGMEPGPPALGAQSLNHSTTREVLGVFLRTELDTHF